MTAGRSIDAASALEPLRAKTAAAIKNFFMINISSRFVDPIVAGGD